MDCGPAAMHLISAVNGIRRGEQSRRRPRRQIPLDVHKAAVPVVTVQHVHTGPGCVFDSEHSLRCFRCFFGFHAVFFTFSSARHYCCASLPMHIKLYKHRSTLCLYNNH